MHRGSQNRWVLLTGLSLVILACTALPGGKTPTPAPGVAPTAIVAPVSGELLAQWASGASASSAYGESDWSALQATGAPNTGACGDFTTAWAAAIPDSAEEWLELSYDRFVFPTEIRIYETYHPGAVVRVEVINRVAEYITIWEGPPHEQDECPHLFVVPVPEQAIPVAGVRITIDQSKFGDWSEIDAVQLIGRPAPND